MRIYAHITRPRKFVGGNDAHASFGKWRTDLRDQFLAGYDARFKFFKLPPFSKFCQIFKILPGFKIDPFSKILTYFQNVDSFSKF